MILLIGFALSALFTFALWRTGGSLTGAAGSVILCGVLVLLSIWALGQPWMTGLVVNLMALRDDLGGSDPWMVLWGLVMLGVFWFVWRTK